MAKRNHRTSIMPVVCPVCGDPKEQFFVSDKPRFKANKQHTDGKPCPKCQERITQMAEILEQGGVLIQCTQCSSVTAQLNIPASQQSHVTQMPDGVKRLEIAGCPLCIKEHTHGQEHETQGP